MRELFSTARLGPASVLLRLTILPTPTTNDESLRFDPLMCPILIFSVMAASRACMDLFMARGLRVWLPMATHPSRVCPGVLTRVTMPRLTSTFETTPILSLVPINLSSALDSVYSQRTSAGPSPSRRSGGRTLVKAFQRAALSAVVAFIASAEMESLGTVVTDVFAISGPESALPSWDGSVASADVLQAVSFLESDERFFYREW